MDKRRVMIKILAQIGLIIITGFFFIIAYNGMIKDWESNIKTANKCIEQARSIEKTFLGTCMGSGTTAVACKELNRNFIGFETDTEYYRKARERLNAK